MGNRIIKIDDEQPKTDGLEVYRDISIISDRKTFIKYPERVQKQGKFIAKDVNVKAVFNSIRNIFNWIQGERILNPEFGSKLRTYLYEGITDMNKERIVAEVTKMCLEWEPRVQIESITPVNLDIDAEDNTVRIDIVFTIPSLSKEQYQYSYIYNRTQ